MSTDASVGLSDRVQTAVAGHTFTITPNTISSFRMGFSRTSVIRFTPSAVPTPTQLGSNVTQGVPGYIFFNVSLIGAGFRGLQLLQQCLAQPSIRIGAVCETYEPRMFGAVALARSQGHSTRAYHIYADLLADSDLDAVLIATPDFSHHRMTLDALHAGKHVYVEQPLCLTWREGVELLTAEKNSRQIIQVGSQRRSSPFFLEASREIGAGKIGNIRVVQANRTSSYLRSGVLRRGGAKLREPLNFPDWQATAASKVPYGPDRFLNWRFYSMYGGGPVCDLGLGILTRTYIQQPTGIWKTSSILLETPAVPARPSAWSFRRL